jgi:hypothetical protein
MSSICPASSAVLALSDTDVVNLRKEKKNKKLLERSLDVQLECEVRFKNTGKANVSLEGVKWTGSSDLCGSCLFCNLVVDGLQRESQYLELHSHYKAFLESVDGGEPETVALNYKLKKLEYHRDPSKWQSGEVEEIEWDVHITLIRGSITLTSAISVANGRPKSLDFAVAFQMFGAQDDPVCEVLGLHRRALASSALCDSNITKIKSWITDCESDHDKCSVPRSDDFSPRRLLDVGDPKCGDGLKLIESSDITQLDGMKAHRVHYLALSYCWGSSGVSLTTTHDTLSSRRSFIAFDSMPQAFQDAVQVARTLGIQYLWIDSLCIIQGDKGDWEAESSKMAEIFSNAHLTIIAARGDSCNESFLRRDPKKTCSVPNNLAGGITGGYGLRYRRHWGGDKMAEILDGKWISRGWTFQEERLARRVLLFGENKFFFDCKTSERMEDTERSKARPDWVDTVQDLDMDEHLKILRPIHRESQPLKIRTSFDHWQTLCSHYSRRQLTYASDKLPAISGIAKQTAKRVESDYLAGLWRPHLLHDLFWHTKRLATRPEVYRAPSWSWASVDGHIAWSTWRWCNSEQCEEFLQILEAYTVVAGIDPYGAVKDGYLKISGKTVEVDRPSSETMLPSSRGQTWHMTYNGQIFANGKLDAALPAEDSDSKLYALLAAKCKMKKGHVPTPRGLVLEKTTSVRDDGLPEFRRIGSFRVTTAEENHLRAWRAAEPLTLIIV